MMPNRNTSCGHVNNAEYCHACGHPATAVWSGSTGTIAICGTCALEVLPSLIVDSVDFPRDWSRGKSLVEQVAAKMWRAMVCRSYREHGRINARMRIA